MFIYHSTGNCLKFSIKKFQLCKPSHFLALATNATCGINIFRLSVSFTRNIFFPHTNPHFFLHYKRLFFCLHFGTSLSSLAYKLAALVISEHKLFFFFYVSTNALVFFEYFSINIFSVIFYVFYFDLYMFRTQIFSAFQ